MVILITKKLNMFQLFDHVNLYTIVFFFLFLFTKFYLHNLRDLFIFNLLGLPDNASTFNSRCHTTIPFTLSNKKQGINNMSVIMPGFLDSTPRPSNEVITLSLIYRAW